MRLTDRTDYAFRVLMYLAVSGAGLATVREIAKRYGVSKNHLAKVAWELGRAGFIEGGARQERRAEVGQAGGDDFGRRSGAIHRVDDSTRRVLPGGRRRLPDCFELRLQASSCRG